MHVGDTLVVSHISVVIVRRQEYALVCRCVVVMFQMGWLDRIPHTLDIMYGKPIKIKAPPASFG